MVLLYANHKIVPDRIDFSRSLNLFKTKEQLSQQTDVYPLLFKVVPLTAKLHVDVLMKSNTSHSESDIKKMHPWILRYFTPADSIDALQERLCRKYNINVNNTLAVWVRGTDKGTEIKNSAPVCYYEKCEKILKNKPNLRVWIQTDQKQYQDYFLNKYPQRAFAINELPVTEKLIGIHSDETFELDRFQFGAYLLAVVILMSQCNSIVTHTGNIGYWEALYRGNLRNFYQDTAHFYRNAGSEAAEKFNRVPFKHKIKNMFLSRPFLKKIQNPYLRRVLGKAGDNFF